MQKLCFAQTTSQHVVGTAGYFFVSSSGSLAWTIGETMVETYQQGQGYLTQGFHQPAFVIVTDVASDPANGIFAYPNPTSHWLTLKIALPGNYSVELYDLKGIKLI